MHYQQETEVIVKIGISRFVDQVDPGFQSIVSSESQYSATAQLEHTNKAGGVRRGEGRVHQLATF